jgi:hypothetical protein
MDWTPAVLITATVSLVTVGLVWLVTPWGPGRFGEPSGPTRPRHRPPAEVVVWTGELAPGLKGVLGPVWGDARPDQDHADLLNDDLGLTGERALAYFRLLVFNTSDETRSLALGAGELVVLGEEGQSPLPLRSLARMVADGEVAIPRGLEFSLRSLGALTESIDVPPGRFAKLVVPFGGSARLDTARTVVTAHGTELHRRQMATAAFRRLIEDPNEGRLKDL